MVVEEKKEREKKGDSNTVCGVYKSKMSRIFASFFYCYSLSLQFLFQKEYWIQSKFKPIIISNHYANNNNNNANRRFFMSRNPE